MKKALIVDVETTGFLKQDEIIEFGGLLFEYDETIPRAGEILETYSGLRHPTIPMSPAARKKHGLTVEALAEHALDENKIITLFNRANILIAHNAQFDKRFLGVLFPMALEMDWYCSMNGIDWKSHHKPGKSLQKLVDHFGITAPTSHRALEDCMAVYKLITVIVGYRTMHTYFDELLRNGLLYNEPDDEQESIIF